MICCLSPNGCAHAEGRYPLKILKVATVSGVVTLSRSADGAWAVEDRALQNLHIGALTFEPREERLFAGAHGGGGLWVSGADGRFWRRSQAGLRHSHIYSLALQGRGDGVAIWAGTEPPALFRSDDLGSSWSEFSSLAEAPGHERWTFPTPPHVSHVKNVAFHEDEPDTLYVCIEQGGFFKSVDGGRSWTELEGYLRGDEKFYRDAHRCVIQRADPRELYLATGDGLAVSPDGGASWSRLTDRSHRVGYPDALAIDPRDENVLYMAGSKHAPEDWRAHRNADAAVVMSRDRGRSWTQMAEGLPSPLRGNIEAMSLYRWGDELALIAGTAIGEVYLSEDAGARWICIAKELPPISKAGHYRWFLSDQDRLKVEQGMRQWGAAS